MTTSTRRLLTGIAVAALALGQAGIALAASPAPLPSGLTGNEMLSVEPSIISASVKAGSRTSTQLTLRAAAELDVVIKGQGLQQGRDGSFKAVGEDQDKSPYSGRSMLTASPSTLHVRPGDVIPVNVDIAVPADAGEGTRYAILTITGTPPSPGDSSNVGFGVELGISTIIQIADTAQTKNGEITGIAIGATLPGKALPVTVSFLNTGTTHYGAIPNELLTAATLQNAGGDLLASGSANGNQLSAIPSFTRDITFEMSTSTPLVDGATYHLEVGVGLKDGTIFDRKALDFTWSGGQVVGQTSAPIQQPPASSGGPSNELQLIIGLIIGAGIVALLFLLLPRFRRRRDDGTGAKAG